MLYTYLKYGQSHVAIFPACTDETKYWLSYIKDMVKDFARPPLVFIGYGKKLKSGVLVVALLQPEFLDRAQYMDVMK